MGEGGVKGFLNNVKLHFSCKMVSLREGVKKRTFYSQADGKGRGGQPPRP